MKKTQYYEILRVIAMFLVIFNHTQGYHLFLGGGEYVGLNLFFSIITRIDVPIFFMISGALLLSKEESIKDLYKKRILKIVIVLIVASVAIYLKNNFNYGYSIKEFIESFFSGEICTSYWYLYSYLATLIMMPFLRKIALSIDNNMFIYLVVLRFAIVTVFPIISYLFAGLDVSLILQPDFNILISTERSIFFMLIGFYVDKKMSAEQERKTIKITGFISLVAIPVIEALTIYDGEKNGYSQNFLVLFDFAMVMFAFVLVKYICTVKLGNNRIVNLIAKVGKLSFGIYLMEPFFRTIINEYIMVIISGNVPILIESFLYCMVAVIIVGCITFLVKKVPIISKLI
ncbi:MAG: acyltransferase [Lachnospiraceae bacterium]|nr:acyltransferase [Lachnospiraceae bacterium]